MIDVIYQFFLIAIDMINSLFEIEIPFYQNETITLGAFIITILTLGTVIGFVTQFLHGRKPMGGNKDE